MQVKHPKINWSINDNFTPGVYYKTGNVEIFVKNILYFIKTKKTLLNVKKFISIVVIHELCHWAAGYNVWSHDDSVPDDIEKLVKYYV